MVRAWEELDKLKFELRNIDRTLCCSEFHLQVVRAWEELDKLKFELRNRNTVLYGF